MIIFLAVELICLPRNEWLFMLFLWQSHRYGDLFQDVWKVFTDHEHTSLLPYAGQRVCISDATFAFLPRMMLGLFYSTPVVRR